MKILYFFYLTFLFANFELIAQNAITLDPRSTTPAQAKLLVEGTGPPQNVFSYYLSLNERMGIKAIAAPTNGTKTSAIVGISDYKLGSPLNESGEATGVIGFSASKSRATGVHGIVDAVLSGSIGIGVKGYASNASDNSISYGGYFHSFREGSINTTGYGIYAKTTHNYGAGTGNSYGGYFAADGSGKGIKVGVNAEINHTNQGAAGVSGIGFQTNIAGQYLSEVIGFSASINNDGNVSGTYGAKLDILGSGSTNGSSIYGLQTNVKGTGTPSYRYGIYSDVDGYTWNNTYGIYARSQVAAHPNVGNGLNSYGGYFVATGSAGNQFGIYATADAPNGGQPNRFAGYFAGNVVVTGTFSNPSDERLKRNIQIIQAGAIDKIMALNPSTFQYRIDEFPNVNFSKGTHYGFTAQVVKQVLPELVAENSIDVASHDDKNPQLRTDSTQVQTKYMAVNYMEMIPILTKAIQEQQEMIKSLQAQIQKLKNK